MNSIVRLMNFSLSNTLTQSWNILGDWNSRSQKWGGKKSRGEGGSRQKATGHSRVCAMPAGLNFPRPVVATFLDPMGSFVDHRAEHSCYFSLWPSKPQLSVPTRMGHCIVFSAVLLILSCVLQTGESYWEHRWVEVWRSHQKRSVIIF